MSKFQLDKILALCDTIAPHLLNMGEISQHDFVKNNSIPGTGQEKNWVLYQLEADGYISRIATSGYDFALTYRGRMFILNNCYKGRFLTETAHDQTVKIQVDSAIKANNSSVDTNDSFKKLNDKVLPANFDFQRKISKRTLLFIIISTLISLGGILTNILLSDKETPQILQKQALSLDSLKQSLQKIDTSFQRFVSDASRR